MAGRNEKLVTMNATLQIDLLGQCGSESLSRIVPVLSSGTRVSTSKNDINYAVTEYGVAQLRGKSAKQRAVELIAIAHPNFRADLTEQAQRIKQL